MADKNKSARERLIAEYEKAYIAANNSPPPDITYNRGWFRIGHPSTPMRMHDLEHCRDRLLARVATPSSGSEG